jgi:heme oxygenase
MDGDSTVPRSAHLVLRESTRAAHDAAEASPCMRRLLAGELDEAAYGELLLAQWRLFRDWEAQRGEWLAGEVAERGWFYVSRVRRLALDLSRDSPAAEAAPAGCGITDVGGGASAASGATFWGELYVVEGSALGGRLIVKLLRQRFPGLSHHFYAIGEDDASPWPCFQSILDTALAGEAAQRAAVNGARRMFARFQQTLQDDAAHG